VRVTRIGMPAIGSETSSKLSEKWPSFISPSMSTVREACAWLPLASHACKTNA